MKKILIIFILFSNLTLAFGTELRLRAMGGMQLAVPDVETQINLYHIANNMAWLKANDSINWNRYTLFAENESGSLHRFWDASELNYYSVVFAGQKHMDEDKIFFGNIRYHVDLRQQVNKAIEISPYDLDPFVLADSTEGDFQYLGPAVFVAFNHQISDDFYWGASLNYQVNRGLKNIYTQPEIISTNIQASIDITYRLNKDMILGLSWAPYQILDITKLTTQSDGQSPQTYRYRGFFEFRKSTGTSDRTSKFKGFDLRPQLAWQYHSLEGVFYFNYRYLWHEIYDGTTTRRYDGYYQEQDYSLRAVSRYYFDATIISIDYGYNYIENWAKEPKADLLFNQAHYNNHHIILGFSHRFVSLPLQAALEVDYSHMDPEENDYLAHLQRTGKIQRSELRAGIEYDLNADWQLRFGYNLIDYTEDEIWNFWGNYQGHMITAGVGMIFSNYAFDIYSRYGTLNGDVPGINDYRDRNFFDFTLQLKHYF